MTDEELETLNAIIQGLESEHDTWREIAERDDDDGPFAKQYIRWLMERIEENGEMRAFELTNRQNQRKHELAMLESWNELSRHATLRRPD